MTSHTTSNASTTSTAKKVLLALGLGLAAAASAVVVISVTGGSDDDSADRAAAATTTSATEPTTDAALVEPAATEPRPEAPVATEPPAPTTNPAEPATDESDEVAPEPVPEPVAEPVVEARPVPTIVIGQDENGEDIIVELEISEVCATTFHQPLDADSFSFIRWEYDAPGLAVDTPIMFEGSDGFSQFTKVTVDQMIIVEQGISSYGEYDFPTAGWTDGDVETSIDPDGSHTVDDREGDASVTCLS